MQADQACFLNGLEGNDTLLGGQGNDLVVGGDGHDQLYGGLGSDTIKGDAGYDRLIYNSETRTLGIVIEFTSVDSGIGRDEGVNTDHFTGIEDVIGSQLGDVMTGNAGTQVFNGDSGNDSLFGLGGDDRLYGVVGNDSINGGDGDDALFGGFGADTLIGGRGYDRIIYTSELRTQGIVVVFTASNTGIVVDEGINTDRFTGIEDVIGSQLNDVMIGESGTQVFNGDAGHDSLFGGTGDDRLYGVTGNDSLGGGAGNDRLDGGADNDTLLGGAGADMLLGGTGKDRLIGGAGADVFVFVSIAESAKGVGRDVITDFVSGTDKIDLHQIDANTTATGDQAFTFGDTTATAFGVWFANGILSGDVNGDKLADFQIALNGTSSITSGDLTF